VSPSGLFRSILLDRPADAAELKDPLVLLRPDLDPVFSAAGADQDGYDLALVGERVLGGPTDPDRARAHRRLNPSRPAWWPS